MTLCQNNLTFQDKIKYYFNPFEDGQENTKYKFEVTVENDLVVGWREGDKLWINLWLERRHMDSHLVYLDWLVYKHLNKSSLEWQEYLLQGYEDKEKLVILSLLGFLVRSIKKGSWTGVLLIQWKNTVYIIGIWFFS